MDEWIDGWMDRWMYVWINGWMDGWMNGWMDKIYKELKNIKDVTNKRHPSCKVYIYQRQYYD